MTFGAAQTSAGKIYKYYNLKWSFLVSMLVFEVGSLICGVAPNSNTLIIGRAIAGLGGAGLSVGGTSIVAFTVRPTKRPMMMGVIAMTYCMAAVLGPLLGGAFTDRVTWRWCFYVNLPIEGLAAAVLLYFFHVPAAGVPPQVTWWKKLLHVDPIGVFLAMGGITCFVLALQYGGVTHPWNSSLVIGPLCRLWTPRGCLGRMGDLARRLRYDAASTLQAAFTLNHGTLPVLLHGQLHCPLVLPPNIFPEYPRYKPYRVWRSQLASCARGSCIRHRRWSGRDENGAGATGHVHWINVSHHCPWSDLHARYWYFNGEMDWLSTFCGRNHGLCHHAWLEYCPSIRGS